MDHNVDRVPLYANLPMHPYYYAKPFQLAPELSQQSLENSQRKHVGRNEQ